VRNRKGFTLVEMMIVVVVIGILAAMALPNLSHFSDHAKVASTKSNAHTLQLALEDYSIRNNGNYSFDPDVLTPLLPGQGLMANVFSGADASEPHFGSPATAPGEIGLEPVIVDGVTIGYKITAYGRDGTVLTIENGSR